MGTQYRISKELVLNEQSSLVQLAVDVEPAPPMLLGGQMDHKQLRKFIFIQAIVLSYIIPDPFDERMETVLELLSKDFIEPGAP